MKIVKLEDCQNLDLSVYFNDIVVIPTETVYGLAARIDNEIALKNIFITKGRPSDNPLIVHVSSIEMVKSIIDGEIPNEYQALIDRFWPGPLTLIFKAKENVSPVINQNVRGSIAIRMPKNKLLRDLIEKLGCPLAAPSANTSGRPSPTTVQHVIDDLGEKVALYIDDGPCEIGMESTVYGVIDNMRLLLRPGGVTKEQIEEVLGQEISLKNKISGSEKIFSPGQKYCHYSPGHPVYLFKGSDWKTKMMQVYEKNKNKKIGLLKRESLEYPVKFSHEFSLGSTLKDGLKFLFAGLRALDKTCDLIFVVEYDLCNEGLAIMDKLDKASSFVL